jgi:copper transport protein
MRFHRVRGLRSLIVGCTVVALTLLAPAAAWAHANLLESTPDDGTVVTASPPQVVLRYDQPVSTAFGAVKVLAPDGTRVDTGQTASGGDSSTVTAPLRPDLPAGTYTILWRVLSQDSHTIFGSSTFSVGQPSSTTAAAAVQEQGEGGRAAEILLAIARGLLFCGLVLLVGGVGFILVLWPAARVDRAARRLVWTGWALAVVGSASALLLEGPYAAARPLDAVFDPSLLGGVLAARYGIVSVVRLLVLAVAAVVLRRPERFPARALPTVFGVLGLGLLVTTSLLGHAGGYDAFGPEMLTDVAHLAAVSAWLGGLALLMVAVLRRDPADIAPVLTRWSRYATVAVVVLVASGTFAAWREVREWGALIGTTYGQLLLVKAGLVAAMLGLAALGRAQVRRHYGPQPDGPNVDEPGAEVAVKAVVKASAGGEEPSTLPQRPRTRTARTPAALRRGVALEAGIAVVVLAVTAVLVGSAPAKDSWFPTVLETATVTGGLQVQVEVRPARVGLNEMRLSYTNGSRPTDVVRVSARWVGQAAGDYQVPARPLRAGPGRYDAGQILLPAAGTWQLAITTQTSDVDATTTLLTVRIR